jgi:hypothetical protein
MRFATPLKNCMRKSKTIVDSGNKWLFSIAFNVCEHCGPLYYGSPSRLLVGPCLPCHGVAQSCQVIKLSDALEVGRVRLGKYK